MHVALADLYIAIGTTMVWRGIPAMVDEAEDRSFPRLLLVCLIGVALWPGELFEPRR